MAIPDSVERRLDDELWKRPSGRHVDADLLRLGAQGSRDFAEFYRRFWGPFRSETIGHELLDLVEQEESISSDTELVRQEFGFPGRFLVLSSLNGLSVLVFDVDSDSVYDVDFEGGVELLKAHKLSPRWNSWIEFVTDYFS